MQLFNSEAIKTITDYLDTYCIDGKCITCPKLCEAVGVDKPLHTVVGTMVREGIIPEYRTYLGPGRGIGRTDTPPPKQKRTPGDAAPMELPSYFLDELYEMLPSLCSNGAYAPRKKIAKEMETYIKNHEAAISAAIKLPRFDKYGMKPGKGGGVYLLPQAEPKEDSVIKPLDTSLEDSVKPSDDIVVSVQVPIDTDADNDVVIV